MSQNCKIKSKFNCKVICPKPLMIYHNGLSFNLLLKKRGEFKRIVIGKQTRDYYLKKFNHSTGEISNIKITYLHDPK